MCWNHTVLGPRKIRAKMDQEYDTHGKEGDSWEESKRKMVLFGVRLEM